MEWYQQEENRSTEREICPNVHLYTTKLMCPSPGPNRSLRCESPLTNHLGHDRLKFVYIVSKKSVHTSQNKILHSVVQLTEVVLKK